MVLPLKKKKKKKRSSIAISQFKIKFYKFNNACALRTQFYIYKPPQKKKNTMSNNFVKII